LNSLQWLQLLIKPTQNHKEFKMMKRTLIMSVLAAVLILSSGFAFAAGQDEQIYGSQLMTQQERIEYRTKMRAAKTAQEREQIRNEYHEQLKERAKESGVTLPDEPPGRGGGMGPGGGGMGPGGSGMGSGGGGMGSGGGGMGPGGGRGY
jgi:uncharacterized membrane protein YgcG